jgi:hypothetical protein
LINESDEILDDLLSRWDHWAASQRDGAGYYSDNPSCKHYRTSRQYDWESGVMDNDQDAQRMEAVDACIGRIGQPYNTALQFNARNLRLGANVWMSPRLPADAKQRAEMLCDAREMLLAELISEGVM